MSRQLKLPVARDVRVHKQEDPPRSDAEGSVSAVSSISSPNMVTVLGFDRKDVLFRSQDVGSVQWRGPGGELAAMLVRLKPGVWGFAKSGDDDWDEVVGLYGNPDC